MQDLFADGQLGPAKTEDTPSPARKLLSAGPIVMDLDHYTVSVANREVHLTRKEFELLHLLLEARGGVLSRDCLLERIWGQERASGGKSRTLHVHVCRLRAKVGREGRRIRTVRNIGYRFDLAPEWIAA